MVTIILRKACSNALHSLQHKQATDLLEQCVAFHADYDTLKYEFAPSQVSFHLRRFEVITGKEDIGLAVLCGKIIYLVETTKGTLEGSSDTNHTDAIKQLSEQLQRMISKTRELKVALEGEGHKYRYWKPSFLVIGASKESKEDLEMEGEGDGYFSDSSGSFQLKPAENSLERVDSSGEERSKVRQRKRDWAEFLNERRLVPERR